MLQGLPPYLLLFTQVCQIGLGLHLKELTAVTQWVRNEADVHLNSLKLRAVLVLSAFQGHFIDHSLALVSYISTVVAYLNKQGEDLLKLQ